VRALLLLSSYRGAADRLLGRCAVHEGWQQRGGAMTATTVGNGLGQVEGQSVVDAAVRFVALQPGGARKILVEHGRRDDGTCAGCLTSPVTWPCVVGMIATKALELDVAR
jgi:hypothetical protein